MRGREGRTWQAAACSSAGGLEQTWRFKESYPSRQESGMPSGQPLPQHLAWPDFVLQNQASKPFGDIEQVLCQRARGGRATGGAGAGQAEQHRWADPVSWRRNEVRPYLHVNFTAAKGPSKLCSLSCLQPWLGVQCRGVSIAMYELVKAAEIQERAGGAPLLTAALRQPPGRLAEPSIGLFIREEHTKSATVGNHACMCTCCAAAAYRHCC